MGYIQSDSSSPILALIAQAGTGKTTFIEYIIHRIDKSKNLQCIFISSEEIKKKFSNVNSLPNIETLYDLYECCDDSRRFDEQKLVIGVTNGSIVIIIDGLEEIIAFFNNNDKFNSESFFNSLLTINNELGKCKVIVTSREPTEIKNNFISRAEVSSYWLRGFDLILVDEYLIKRFVTKATLNKEMSEKHINKVNKYLNNIKEKILNNNKIIPYILDLICESVEEEFEEEREDLTFNLHDEYLSNHDIIDNIVYSYFFERELTRQTYPEGFTVRDLAYIFLGFAIDLGWVFSKEKMIENIKLSHFATYHIIVDNIEKSPLLKKSKDGSFKFKYDFLYNYFICLFLIQEFGGEKTYYNVLKVLSNIPNEIIDDFTKYFSGDKSVVFMKNAKRIHQDILKRIIATDLQDDKIAVSNILLLLVMVNSQTLSTDKNMNLLKELYNCEDNILKNLYIYHKFVPLDFSDMEIWNSDFTHYYSFFKSKYKKTKFLYSSFNKMKCGYKNEEIWQDINFDTCELGDMKTIISKENIKLDSKQRILNILTEIQSHKFNYTIENKKYIECLILKDFIKEENNSYTLIRKGKQFLKNGTITVKTKELFNCINS